MDYGSLVSTAWRQTWRHRPLWLLGMFAATTMGSCSGSSSSGTQWRTDARELGQTIPGAERAGDAITLWLVNNFTFVTAVVVFLVLLGAAILVISTIAQGAMAQATVDVSRGRPVTLGQAWDTGLRLFWRYLGLWLVLIALGIAFLVILAFLGFGFFAGAILARDSAGPLLAAGGILLFLLVLLFLPVVFAVTVAAAYAQRAIVAEDIGPLAALGVGFGLLRRRLGASLAVWLITLVLGIVAGIVVGLIAVLLAVPLGGLGAVLFMSAGISAGLVAYVVVALITFIAALWFVAGIANTYFWHLWTLTYLRLTGGLDPAPVIPPTPEDGSVTTT